MNKETSYEQPNERSDIYNGVGLLVTGIIIFAFGFWLPTREGEHTQLLLIPTAFLAGVGGAVVFARGGKAIAALTLEITYIAATLVVLGLVAIAFGFTRYNSLESQFIRGTGHSDAQAYAPVILGVLLALFAVWLKFTARKAELMKGIDAPTHVL